MSNFNNIFDRKRNEGGPREGDFRKKSFGGKKQFGRRDDSRGGGRLEMHEATCSECGKRCEVPFRPTGDKPVYCSECFTKRGGGNDRNERRGGGNDRPRFGDKKMFDATCDKCGKRFELPFRPTGEKPVYCNDCFDRGSTSTSSRPADNKPAVDYKEQFDALNAKLDKLIKALTPIAPAKEEKKEVVIEKKEAVVVTKEKKAPAAKKENKSKKVEVKKVVAKKKKAKK